VTLCKVDGCELPPRAKGLCDKHYQRLRHRGDPVNGTRRKVPRGTICAVDGCERRHFGLDYCKPHYRRLIKYGDPLAGDVLPEHIDLDGTRECRKCTQRKPLDEFPPSSDGRAGRLRTCKACTKERIDAWYAENRAVVTERNRLYRIKRIYGDVGLEVEKRRLAGDGCDACGKRTEPMTIDHCHTTGQTRGLLCKPCNFILGIAEDDSKRLRALADYLDEVTG